MLAPHPFSMFANPRFGKAAVEPLSLAGFERAKAEITAWRGYAPTPLRDLPALATEYGVECIRMKDEGERFGLGSFKALGGAYAVAAVLSAELARRGVTPQVRSRDLERGTWR